MNLDRLRSPVEEFVNEVPQIGSAQRMNSSIMDQRQQKYALGILVAVAVTSVLLGFLGMFGIAQKSLYMQSRLTRNSVVDEKFITDEIFQRINADSLQQYLQWLAEKPHPSGQTRENEIALWIKTSLEHLEFDYVTVDSYEVMLSLPSNQNKVRNMVYGNR